jgi:MerR HTH family regulatory protein
MSSKTVITAFSDEQVERLTGVTRQQLRYWDRTGFFRPTFASEDRRAAYSRIYPTLTEKDVKAAIKHKGDGMAA